MLSLDAVSAAAYLRSTGRVAPSERIEVRELPGGVSNIVLYVARPDVPSGDFVLKQSRAQLRVAQPWFCSVERIWREVEVLRICEEVLSDTAAAGGDELVATTPGVLWEDRENYAFAMSAAPPHVVWKEELLGGRLAPRIAAACGRLLARLHAATWRKPAYAARLAGREFFIDLRVDPYYRRVAEVHPELRPMIEPLIASVQEHALALVHGDFSPKNLLVHDGGLMLVDCEVGHFGDPAFDLGFFLSHLSLKAILQSPGHTPLLALAASFWQTYQETIARAVGESERAELVRRGIANLAGCALARVDGKSPVEYLDPRRQDAARRFAVRLFHESPADWAGAEQILRDVCEAM